MRQPRMHLAHSNERTNECIFVLCLLGKIRHSNCARTANTFCYIISNDDDYYYYALHMNESSAGLQNAPINISSSLTKMQLKCVFRSFARSSIYFMQSRHVEIISTASMTSVHRIFKFAFDAVHMYDTALQSFLTHAHMGTYALFCFENGNFIGFFLRFGTISLCWYQRFFPILLLFRFECSFGFGRTLTATILCRHTPFRWRRRRRRKHTISANHWYRRRQDDKMSKCRRRRLRRRKTKL